MLLILSLLQAKHKFDSQDVEPVKKYMKICHIQTSISFLNVKRHPHPVPLFARLSEKKPHCNHSNSHDALIFLQLIRGVIRLCL